MSVQPDRIKALISNIDEALTRSNPRPPLVVMGDSIMHSRQVLEQVRSYLQSLEPSHPTDNSDIIPRYSDLERQSLEQSLRLIIREELQGLQTQFTETIQAEIQAMRQERRILIRELRGLRQHRQQAETTQQTTQPSPPSPSPVPTVIPQTEPYIYPSRQEQAPELFPYAGVELPPSFQFKSLVTPGVAIQPQESQPQELELEISPPTELLEPTSTATDEGTPETESMQAELEISPPSETAEFFLTPNTQTETTSLESVAPELEISTHSEPLEPTATATDQETLPTESIQAELENSPLSETSESFLTPNTQTETTSLESVAPELEISTPSEPVESPSTQSDEEIAKTESIQAELENSPLSEHPEPTPLEIPADRPHEISDVFGVFDLSESILESPVEPSSSVIPTQSTDIPNPIHELLDQEGYIQASPHEDLLPRAQEEDDEPLDSHLMVGKSIRQLLEEDLINLEQQSFIGEEDPNSDFSTVEDTSQTSSSTPSSTPSSRAIATAKTVETFEDLWSQTSLSEINPFAEANASEMTLDEILTTIDEDEVKTNHSENESDLEDFNFESLNRKLPH
ncbi:hypothetical protein [Lyngbya aestuarii]|uniref:hypothetical protein n=1 Tax=Lyngbya aestuarii TaxID=118322 RepID=UPI00128FA2E1|nr:hypothetical protein [Lyngbya aestuarii]